MIYDRNTIDQLCNRYGPERAIKVAMGEDEPTIADLAAWERLGGITLPQRDDRLAEGRRLVRQGATVEAAAEMASVGVIALKSSLQQRFNSRPSPRRSSPDSPSR